MSSVLSKEKNVLGGPLLACSYDPLTGFFRDGCCATHDVEGVAHLVCIKATDMFEIHGRKLTAALRAASLLGASSVWAQATERMGPMRDFKELHKELNLNAQQEELWKKAEAAQRELFRSMRAKREETRAK